MEFQEVQRQIEEACNQTMVIITVYIYIYKLFYVYNK